MSRIMQEAVQIIARTVACPLCMAPKGEPCYGPIRDKPRLTHHTARNDLAMGREVRLPRHPEHR